MHNDSTFDTESKEMSTTEGSKSNRLFSRWVVLAAGALTLGLTAGPALATGDAIIDADGIASPGTGIPGAVEVTCGDPLASFPVTGIADAGLDWFDNDHNGQWTFGANGDDLHSEDPNTCPTAIRDGIHQLGLDCKVLDLNGDLANGQQVDCDLEVSAAFTEPHASNGGCPSAKNNIRYHDANGDGSWDNGEDIVYDANGNGVFDCAPGKIPATSSWGVAIMGLLLLVGAKVYFNRRRALQA